MTFALMHGGPHLFRERAHIEWVEPTLRSRASDLGWNGRETLVLYDSDGVQLGGFVPDDRRAA